LNLEEFELILNDSVVSTLSYYPILFWCKR